MLGYIVTLFCFAFAMIQRCIAYHCSGVADIMREKKTPCVLQKRVSLLKEKGRKRR